MSSKGTVTLNSSNGYKGTQSYELEPDQGVFVGRSSNCGVKLSGAGLSDIHCRVALEGDKLWIQDWMSAEGTRVNGAVISTKTEIRGGDIIAVGQNEITVEVQGTSQLSAGTASAGTASIGTASTSVPSTGVPSTSVPSTGVPSTGTPSAGVPSAGTVDKESGTGVDWSAMDAMLKDEPAEKQDDRPSPPAAQHDEPSIEELLRDAAVGFDETPDDSGVLDFGDDLFDAGEEITYDRETVALLEAEIEDLRSALARQDAQRRDVSEQQHYDEQPRPVEEASDELLNRMQELIDEANRSDERAAILEEALHAAEDANRAEQDERGQLEAWVGDIEKRIGQREEEHAAEIEALRHRLDESNQQLEQLQNQLRQAATSVGSAPTHYKESLEDLQEKNNSLQEKLAESQKQLLARDQKIGTQSKDQDRNLREERANLAKEQAKISRMRHQISGKLAAIEELPKSENLAEKDSAARIKNLREHLREIYEQEKQEEKEATLGTRLAKLWKRVDEY